MKRILLAIWAISFLLVAQPLIAADICSLGAQVVGKDKKQVEEFYKRMVEGQLITGTGTIDKLTKIAGDGMSSNYEARILCSPKVVVIVRTNDFGVKASRAKKGVVVSFKGSCTKMYLGASGKIYCLVRASIS